MVIGTTANPLGPSCRSRCPVICADTACARFAFERLVQTTYELTRGCRRFWLVGLRLHSFGCSGLRFTKTENPLEF